MTKLILGCGYLGGRVGQRWLAAGHTVHVLTRSPARAGELESLGYEPIVGDVTRPSTFGRLPAADTILFAVGYDRSADPSIDEVYVDGLKNVVEQLDDTGPDRFVYISSTGVYAQTDGGWVDEASPCRPATPGGRACLAAEQLLRGSRLRNRTIVLRLAGIYGPGRVPGRASLMAGHPIRSTPDGYLNLIHVEDAADVVVAGAAGLEAPAVFLVADGRPVLREEYYRLVADLLGAPDVRFADSGRNPKTAPKPSNKRISNRRLMDALAPVLSFPSYREGLRAILRPSPNPSG